MAWKWAEVVRGPEDICVLDQRRVAVEILLLLRSLCVFAAGTCVNRLPGAGDDAVANVLELPGGETENAGHAADRDIHLACRHGFIDRRACGEDDDLHIEAGFLEIARLIRLANRQAERESHGADLQLLAGELFAAGSSHGRKCQGEQQNDEDGQCFFHESSFA